MDTIVQATGVGQRPAERRRQPDTGRFIVTPAERPQMPDTGQVTRNGSGAGGAEAPAGLAGVVVAHTRIGDVRGLEGFYQYRQYDAIELSTQRTLETCGTCCSAGTCPTTRSGPPSPTRSPATGCCRTSLFPSCAHWPRTIRLTRWQRCARRSPSLPSGPASGPGSISRQTGYTTTPCRCRRRHRCCSRRCTGCTAGSSR